MPLGDHAETIFFTALSTFLFFELLAGRNDHWGYAACLGFISGFGSWFAYIFFLTPLTAVLFLLLYPKHRPNPKIFWTTLAFFVLGVSPWIALNLLTGFAGLRISETSIWNCVSWQDFASNLKRYTLWPLYELFATFALTGDHALPVHRWANRIYPLLFYFPIIGLALATIFRRSIRPSCSKFNTDFTPSPFPLPLGEGWGEGKSQPHETTSSKPNTEKTTSSIQGFPTQFRPLPVIHFYGIYLILFMTVSLFSGFHALRYRIPAQPFLYTLCAYSLVRLEERFNLPIQQWILKAGLFLLLIFGTLSSSSRLSFSAPGWAYSRPGYSYAWLGQLPVCMDLKRFLKGYPNFEKNLDSNDLYTLSSSLIGYQFISREMDDLDQSVAEYDPVLPDSLKTYFYYFLGVEMVNRWEADLGKVLAKMNSMKSLPPHHYRALRYGILIELGDVDIKNAKGLRLFEPFLSGDELAWYWRSAGTVTARSLYGQNITLDSFREAVRTSYQAIPESYRPFFVEGLGAFLCSEWNMDLTSPGKLLAWSKTLPSDYRHSLFRGIGIGFRTPSLMNIELKHCWRWENLNRSLNEDERLWMREGLTVITETLNSLHPHRITEMPLK